MLRIVSFALLALGAALPCAAQYPDRPLTLLAGFPAGGLVDIVSRVVAEGMKPKFPKGIVVVNKSGEQGNGAVRVLRRARQRRAEREKRERNDAEHEAPSWVG